MATHQRTYRVRLRDRETGMVFFGSLRVRRSKSRAIELNPTPGLAFEAERPVGPLEGQAALVRLRERQLRLAVLLRRRLFGEGA
jgi:hypothetical protein